MEEILRLIGAGVLGGLIGAYSTHRLTVSRERLRGIADRRRDILSFLHAWRAEFDRKHFVPGGFMWRQEVFDDALPQFRALAEAVRRDYCGARRAEFERLLNAVTSCESHKQADVIRSVEDITAYIEK